MQNPVEQIELKAYEFWKERATSGERREADWYKAAGELAEGMRSRWRAETDVGKVVAAVSDVERN